MPDPRGEYQARLEQRGLTRQAAEGRAHRISNLRLTTFGLFAITAVAMWQLDGSLYWLVPPTAAFIGLVIAHERTARAVTRAKRAEDHYRAALRRIDGTWPGTGVAGDGLAPADHPYAADLDLFGHGSVFELLCTARTAAGMQTLARWLTTPSEADAIPPRQQAVSALRERLDLREDLAAAGQALNAEVDPAALAAWGGRSAFVSPGTAATWRLLAWGCAMANVAAVALWIWGPWSAWPLAVTVAATWLAGKRTRAFTDAVSAGIERPSRELAVVAAVLHRLEAEPLDAGVLGDLAKRLSAGPRSAAASIAHLVRLSSWLEAQKTQLFSIIAWALMWGVHFGLAIERWRREHGAEIESWFDALGELEALLALAGYTYEHPDDPFPQVVAGAPQLDGRDLGHPLLDPATCVRNSVRLGGDCQALVVSGSNMSGKSTYLRTVGINVVLALCGAPVRATALTLSPLRVGATLRIQDSLQEGASRFFAEITRLRRVMDIADQGPGLLFLLDEILHGTNSHDRRIGAIAVVRNLLDRGAIGLVTTHDLALADAADALPGHVRNVHFADQLDDGELRFDYRVYDGVVRTSNALALMRSVGLSV